MDTTAGLEPPRTPLDAGQEGRVTLSVRNDSEIVEDYTFQVVGDPAEWSSTEPTHVSVYPGQTTTAMVTFRPPRNSSVQAGEHSYGVHVRPAKRPENASVPEGIVEVLPFYDTVAELSPQSTKSKGSGTYRVAVQNRGNAPVAVALAGKSASDGMDLALSESEQTMEPGTTWSSRIRAEPVKRLWRGAPVAYPFTVMVTPEEGPALALAGTQYQDPVLPSGIFKALVGLVAFALVLGLGAWTFMEKRFPPWSGPSAPTQSPTGTEESVDETSGSSSEEPADGIPGSSSEEPADGIPGSSSEESAVETAEASTEPDVWLLPSDMIGQPADPLIDEIRSWGVNIIRYEEPSTDAQPGTVLRTQPVGGSTVQSGDTIEMWVAIEPQPNWTFPDEITLSAPPNGEPVDWPADPVTDPFTITSMKLLISEGDLGTFRMELLGPTETPSEVLIEDVQLMDLLAVEDLVTPQGSTMPSAEATGGIWTGPIEPIRVEAGEKLRMTLTCTSAANGTDCSETLIVDGRFG